MCLLKCFLFLLVIVGYILYKRSRWNTPQTLDHCSNADSIGYLDDMFKVSISKMYFIILSDINNVNIIHVRLLMSRFLFITT